MPLDSSGGALRLRAGERRCARRGRPAQDALGVETLRWRPKGECWKENRVKSAAAGGRVER
jgi:hypothetical protein